jgi:hypothetical protein
MPKRSKRTLAIFMIAIVGFAAGITLVWWNSQRTPEEEFKLYSNYGFSFEYPKDMEISQNTSAMDSGTLLGELGNGELELIRVGWFTIELPPDLEISLNMSFLNLEAEGLTIEKGQLKSHTTVDGHEMLYQSFTATSAEAVTFQGISGVWYCDTSIRSFDFVLMLMNSEQDINLRFQQYISSFTC